MYITLALVVLVFSIIVFFSQEFSRAIKKLFSITGAKIILPMAAFSWAIYTFNEWFLWAVYYVRDALQSAVNSLMHILPFQKGAHAVAMIIVLTLLSVIPSLILQWLAFRQRYKEYKYPYLTSTIIWITASVLLLVL